MRRWIERVVFAVLAAAVLTYLGDLAIFKLRGSPVSTVTVNRYLTVPLKGNKIEYDYIGSTDVPCSISLFPQAGQSPCWYLRRNPNQNTNL